MSGESGRARAASSYVRVEVLDFPEWPMKTSFHPGDGVHWRSFAGFIQFPTNPFVNLRSPSAFEFRERTRVMTTDISGDRIMF